jgi:hypothetical protein
VRSLDEEQRHHALLSPVAPVDLVPANRARLADGDRPLHLAEVWRGRFRGELAERIDRIQATAEEAAGLRDEHLEAVSWSDVPKGLRAAALRPDQREVLRALLDVYVGRVPEELADEEAAKYAADDDLAALSFAWAGGLEPGEPHYYRVQGARLLAEYDNTQRGANHIHTVWRDPVGDFGDDVLARHYRQGHGSHHHPH